MDFDQETQQPEGPKPWEVFEDQPHWLTSEQIDRIVDNASADDIIEAMAAYPADDAPLQLTREIFNRSAARLGMTNGQTASQMVKASDFMVLTEKLSHLLATESPLGDATDLSPISVASGDSVPET